MNWTVDEEYDGFLLRDYLLQVRGFSRRILKGIKFDGGQLLVNGEDSRVRRVLQVGDKVEVLFPPEKKGSFMNPELIQLDIVYEDDDVLVVNKPPGMATIPSFNHGSGTLANGILGYYQTKQIPYTIHIVTRLDKDTSGLVLVAKHRFSHSILSKDQKLGKVNRSYFAIIEGQMVDKEGTIEEPIARKPDSIIERMVHENGQRAVTHYRVKEKVGPFSLMDIKLETGRTHQIRVHFSYLDHPLVGDSLYGGSTTYMERQALHCQSLAFTQPLTNQRLSFTCEIPEDMKGLLCVGEK
ncbi:RluA family pseudouridine synthase [Aquibacillus kalidii]|uniref:RluA family pseudouridine synthase n=1 Tax=Aquibacillus kalidii TaxID=2762597 RepID=UPI0016448C1B|nr:RluA family pseudouridine synthase [Aquibacillus kalidii]